MNIQLISQLIPNKWTLKTNRSLSDFDANGWNMIVISLASKMIMHMFVNSEHRIKDIGQQSIFKPVHKEHHIKYIDIFQFKKAQLFE